MDPKQIIELGKLDIINPEDVGYLLLGSTKAKRTERTFNVEKYSDDDCIKNFRFARQDLINLAEGLQIPPEVTTPTGTRFDAIEGLCILLRRLCYPVFGKSSNFKVKSLTSQVTTDDLKVTKSWGQ